MKITQYYENESIRLGKIDNETIIPLDFKGDMIDLIESGKVPLEKDDPIPLDNIRFAPAVSRPSKIICIGLNYLDHIREGNAEVPTKPIIFAKFLNALIGHKDSITWDTGLTGKVDFEGCLYQ